MRRLLVLLLVAACLLPDAGPVRAQTTADQLNKLSLEALTTPAPGGNPGSYRRSARRSAYRGPSQGRRSYARRYSYARQYSARRPSYTRRSFGHPRRGYGAAYPYGRSDAGVRRYDRGRQVVTSRSRHASRHYAAPHHYRRRYR